MRARKIRVVLLLLVLTSCSLFRSTEEKTRQLAIDTALAYFTFDYENQAAWMQSVQDEYYYNEFIKDRVLPVLGPYLAKYFLKSTAELVSIEEAARGTGDDGADVIIWEIKVKVNPRWPVGGPPAFPRAERNEVPWTNGDPTRVYAAAANRLGVWNLRLLTAESAKKVILGLAEPTQP